MSTKWDVPFNAFGWSIAIFLLFALIQTVVVTAFTFAGTAISAYLALFTWGAVSSAIAYSLISRYSAALRHLCIVQGFACFYALAVSVAVNVRLGNTESPTVWIQAVGTVAALFAVGVMGIALARILRERLAR